MVIPAILRASCCHLLFAGCGIAGVFASANVQAQVVYSSSGATPAAIQPTVDSFRAALGTLNANTVGSFAGGRREINWDGVPDQFSAPNAMPGNFFNVNSPRGVVFLTPGTGLQTSSNSTVGPVRFGNVDASYVSQFQTFSPQRLFRAIGSNILRVDFFVPGTTTPASISGFGLVFTDVESPGSAAFTTTLADGTAGGQFSAPTSASGGLSFIGVVHPRRFSQIVIRFGTGVMAAGTLDSPGGGVDLVAMDDFIYGEPQQLATLDVDRSVTATKYDALTDGVTILRYMLNQTGPSLTAGSLGATATNKDPAAIKSYLDYIRTSLDIDGNGVTDAMTDGLLILRYLFGLRGPSLVTGAFDPAGSRNSATAIEPYIQSLMP